MRIITFLFIFISFTSSANDKAIEIMNGVTSQCKPDFIKYQKELASGYLAHKKKIWLDEAEQLLKVRSSVISEGAINSQLLIDELLLNKVASLFLQNDLIPEQKSRVSSIKETLMTYPLKVSESELENLKNKFEVFGI